MKTDILCVQYSYGNGSLSFSHNEKYFKKKFVGKIKTHTLCTVTLFPKIVSLMK